MSSDSGSDDEEVFVFVNPFLELNLGLWFLFAGATVFLVLRLYFKHTRGHKLWYDDYVLLVSWIVLCANNSLIVHEFASGYVLEDSSKEWSNHMRLLITISSCGTLIGQAWTKTAFGVTLTRMSNRWQQWILWFCIVTMNTYMVIKVILQWARVCGDDDYTEPWRLDLCLESKPRDDLKEGGNVYNIIMDFVFASFPWLIFRSLKINRSEKIGLCVTMSLGMVVAIVSAIRVGWKDEGNERDAWYIYRNGLSQVWYSSEITGTIMVQCIPILRPVVREIQTSRISKKLGTSTDVRSYTYGSKSSGDKWMSATVDRDEDSPLGRSKQEGFHVALREISRESAEPCPIRSLSSISEADCEPGTRPASPPATWLHSDSEESELRYSPAVRIDAEHDASRSSLSPSDLDVEAAPARGLSLPRPHG